MSANADDPQAVDLVESLSLQLSEVEMLSSMFPDGAEFCLDDPGGVAEIQGFVDGQIDADSLQSRIGFTVRLTIAEQNMELVCRLPHEYPSVLPLVFIRAASLSRAQHQSIGEAVQTHLESLEPGELLIGPLIEWLQANAAAFLETTEIPSTKSAKTVDPKSNMFSRMWIYSHHIYSKIKRKDMLEFGEELNLTGFYVPGKPGIIIIEGYNNDVETFWGRIRRMQWKKLTMREKEDCDMGDKSVDDFRKFGPFEERYFAMRQGKGRGAHCDRGALYQYLDERGFGKMFNIYFNVDGKHTEGDD